MRELVFIERCTDNFQLEERIKKKITEQSQSQQSIH